MTYWIPLAGNGKSAACPRVESIFVPVIWLDQGGNLKRMVFYRN